MNLKWVSDQTLILETQDISQNSSRAHNGGDLIIKIITVILILMVTFSFKKCLNGQNHSRIVPLPLEVHSHYNCEEQVVLSNRCS